MASLGLVATFTDVLRARHISVQWVSRNGDSSIHYIGGNKVLRQGKPMCVWSHLKLKLIL